MNPHSVIYDGLINSEVRKEFYKEYAKLNPENPLKDFSGLDAPLKIDKNDVLTMKGAVERIEFLHKGKKNRNNLVFFLFTTCLLTFFSILIYFFFFDLEQSNLISKNSSIIGVISGLLTTVFGLIYKSENKRTEETEKDLRNVYMASVFFELINESEDSSTKKVLWSKLESQFNQKQ